jgi:hypothetical protein
MADANQPLIQLEPGGSASILRYNVPEPTSYTGRNLIALDFPSDYFKEELRRKPAQVERTEVAAMDADTLKSAIVMNIRNGFADRSLFPNVRTEAVRVRFGDPSSSAPEAAVLSPELASLNPDTIAAKMRAGMRLNIYKSLYGAHTCNFIQEPKEAVPQIVLVETYRLSSFLGNYGAGRTLKTLTLLPGEKMKISVKTYTKTEQERKAASSILDSFTQESANEFEDLVQSEQSDKQNSNKSFAYDASVEANASWGFGSAKVSYNKKKESSSAREEFAKNVTNATQKQAAKSSAKRDVQINTSYEVKEETGEEMSIERQIENINVSRTLNFVFRQMNQEFVTLLHLVDVRIAFFNGFPEFTREVALPALPSLLDDVLVDDQAKRDEVKAVILNQLRNVFDFEDNRHEVIEQTSYRDSEGDPVEYVRFRRTLASTYSDPSTGFAASVPGIIMSAVKSILRTEGIIVEALLGQGQALDSYAQNLQEVEVARRRAEAEEQAASAARAQLINEIVRAGDADKARVLSEAVKEPSETSPLSVLVRSVAASTP